MMEIKRRSDPKPERKPIPQSLHDEWHYRYEERLGILSDGDKPTDAEKEIARRETDEWFQEEVAKL